MNSKFSRKISIVVLLPSIVLSTSVGANINDVLIKEQPHAIYHVIKQKTLLEAANLIANRSGITFKISADLENDVITKKLAADNWQTALSQLLDQYNYTTASARDTVKTVLITSRHGSGNTLLTPGISESALIEVEPNSSAKLPGRYKDFAAGSVFPVKLPIDKLNSIPLGGEVTLDLPIGQYQVKHDNQVEHSNENSTWIGYLNEEGKGYRVFLSQGETGIIGNIYTPDGAYNIETVGGETVIVDIGNSGLGNAGYDHDQAEAAAEAVNLSEHGLQMDDETTKIENAASADSTSDSGTPTVVDLMVLYTTVNQTASYAKQRIKYLVDVSNQAYEDSGINVSLRLVHTRQTSYSENSANPKALEDLATGKGAFANTAALRNQYGADLVVLFRPLHAKTSESCGTTYVGFANGGKANPRLGFSTVSDGYSRDANSNYYCETNTFPHEIGHSFGNVHDREYSDFTGIFDYSYAWGINGKFGTIMSYYGPSVMLFSTPSLTNQCAGTACGFPEGDANASDQTRTTNYTAPIVARYRPTKTTVPMIQ